MDGKHTIKRDRLIPRMISALLVILMLLPVLPELGLRAHASYEGEIDGKTYYYEWDFDNWGTGMVRVECEACGGAYEQNFYDFDYDDVAEEMISDHFPYEGCNCCEVCGSEENHCENCGGCFVQGDVERCECESPWCIMCHLDEYYCDLCGSCVLQEDEEEGWTARQSSTGWDDMSNLGVVCYQCYMDSEACSICGETLIKIGSYVVADENGDDWCENCGMCRYCYDDPERLREAGHCIECGVCGGESDVCETCFLCSECREGVTHCPECDECWGGEIEWCVGGGTHCVHCDEGNDWICDQCSGCCEVNGTEICEDCGFCSVCCLENSESDGCVHGYCIEGGDYADHLCFECGLCPYDTECEFCGLCENCQEEYHCQHGLCPDDDEYYEHVCDGCSDCFELDELCELCHMCYNCWDHCEKHGMCPEDSDYEDHLCWGCGECFDEEDLCELCHMCEGCRVHCDKHDICSEDPEYEDHVCASCGECFDEEDLCEYCHMCEDCREHCDAHDICSEDPEYEDHTCASCGDCFEEDEFCEFCHLCLDCCHAETESYGCDHGICVEDPDFEDHYCFEHGQCVEYCDHYGCDHENLSSWKSDSERHWRYCLDCGLHVFYSKHAEGEYKIVKEADPMLRVNGVIHVPCRDCGKVLRTETIRYIDIPTDGTPYISSQPKDYTGKVSNVEYGDVPRYATFKISAGGKDLSYQWYMKTAKGDVALTDRIGDEAYYSVSGEYEISGAKTKSLTVMVPGDACRNEYEYYCVVSNAKGSVNTRVCKIAAAHDYAVTVNNGDGTHSIRCAGCELTKGKPKEHRMSALETVKPATATENGMHTQRCLDCDYRIYLTIWKLGEGHVHNYKYYGFTEDGHRAECACGKKKDGGYDPHTFGAWTVTKEATEQSTGRREHSCTVCGYVAQETIEKLPHTHDFVTPKDPDLPLFVPPNGGQDAGGHYRFCSGCTSRHYEDHSMGMWYYSKKSSVDSGGKEWRSVMYRSCSGCGYTENVFTDKDWPVVAEPYDSGEGRALGATISGPVTANAGEKVTLSYTLTEGYVVSGFGLGGSAWGVSDVSSDEGLYIRTKWYGYANGSVTDFKVNSDGTLTFTMPAGPVGILLLTEKCSHAGASTYSDTVEPTCTGYGAHVLRCSVCRGVTKEIDRIDPLGHSYETVYVEEYGDCDRRDLLDVRCTACGNERQMRGDFRHSYEEVGNDVAPGCKTPGKESDFVCEECGDIIRGKHIAPIGKHSFGKTYNVREATTTVKGIIAHDCVRCGFSEQKLTDYSGPDYRLAVDKKSYVFSFTYGENPKPLMLNFRSVGRDAVTKITDFIDLDGLAKQGWRVKQTGNMSVSIQPDPEMLILNEIKDLDLIFTVGAILEGEEFSAPNIRIKAAITYPKEKRTLTVEDVRIACWDDAKLTWIEENGEVAAIRPGTRVRLTHIEGLTVPVDDWIIYDESRAFENRRGDYSAYNDGEEYFFVMPDSDLTIKAGNTQCVDEVAFNNFTTPQPGEHAYAGMTYDSSVPFTVGDVYWIDGITGDRLSGSDVFELGRDYIGIFYLKPKRGWYFDKLIAPSTVTINGSEKLVTLSRSGVEPNGNYRLVTDNMTVKKTGTIEEVYLTLNLPGDGGYTGSYPKTVNADGDPEVIFDLEWKKFEDGRYVPYSGRFTQGETLYLYMHMSCTNPARTFDYDDSFDMFRMEVFVNGEGIYPYYDEEGRVTVDIVVEVGERQTTLSLSEFMITTLDPEYPDGSYTHLDAWLETSDPGYSPSMIWTSSDPSVVTVEIWEGDDRAAIVTATGYGEAVVTCRTADGLYSASVPVRNSRPAVTGVEVDRFSVEVLYPRNQGFRIYATVFPENAGNKRVLWRSSDEAVATVSSNGDVSPRGRGICWITAVTEDGEYESTCEVIVRDPVEYDLWIDQIQVTEENMSDILVNSVFSFDGDRTLTVSADYTARYSHALIVSSIPDLVVKVTGDATLTGREGVMRLSADTTITGPGELTVSSATVSPIYVMEGSTLTVDRTTLNANGPGGLMGDAEGERLIIDGATVNAEAKVEGWAIYDFNGGVTLENVVVRTPEDGGFVGGTIKAADGSDVAKASVGPRVAVKGVEISASELSLKAGDTAALSALVEPLDATNRTCVWSTTDRTVAKVNENGAVTAIGAGEARITVKTNDGRFTASCLVTVTEEASHVHALKKVAKAAPTCTGAGKREYYRCECGRYFEDASAKIEIADIGAWGVIPATGHDFGTDDNAEKCSKCGAKNPNYKPPVKPVKFDDVPAGAYYAEPVSWAVANGITQGTAPGRFSPDAGCTRGQVVTFLWRAAGQPEPKSSKNPFTDVTAADYYYKAVLWAVEKGVTAGTSTKTFSPNATCTRGQIVTFLYRNAGSPAVGGMSNPFTDVKPGDYFMSAVLWAVENGITKGTSATAFSPNATCTRAQVVTFLYRSVG